MQLVLDAKIDKVEHRLEVKMEQLERRLEEKINKVAHDLEKFKIYIEKHIDHKFFKHTTIAVMAIIINDMAMSDSLKRLLLTIIHSG